MTEKNGSGAATPDQGSFFTMVWAVAADDRVFTGSAVGSLGVGNPVDVTTMGAQGAVIQLRMSCGYTTLQVPGGEK